MSGILLAYLNEPGSIKLWDGVTNPASVKQRRQSCWWGVVCLFSALWGLPRGFSSTMHTRFMAEISGKADLIRLWLGSKAWDHALEQMTWINSCRRGTHLMGNFQCAVKKKEKDFFVQKEWKLLISKDEHPSIKIWKDTGMLLYSHVFWVTDSHCILLVHTVVLDGLHTLSESHHCCWPSSSVRSRLLALCLSLHGSERQPSLFSFASTQRRGTFGPLYISRFILHLQV